MNVVSLQELQPTVWVQVKDVKYSETSLDCSSDRINTVIKNGSIPFCNNVSDVKNAIM
jgi:hypothetical protein